MSGPDPRHEIPSGCVALDPPAADLDAAEETSLCTEASSVFLDPRVEGLVAERCDFVPTDQPLIVMEPPQGTTDEWGALVGHPSTGSSYQAKLMKDLSSEPGMDLEWVWVGPGYPANLLNVAQLLHGYPGGSDGERGAGPDLITLTCTTSTQTDLMLKEVFTHAEFEAALDDAPTREQAQALRQQQEQELTGSPAPNSSRPTASPRSDEPEEPRGGSSTLGLNEVQQQGHDLARSQCGVPSTAELSLATTEPVDSWTYQASDGQRTLWTSGEFHAGVSLESCGTPSNPIVIPDMHRTLHDQARDGWGIEPVYSMCTSQDDRPIDELAAGALFSCTVWDAGGSTSLATGTVVSFEPGFKLALAE